MLGLLAKDFLKNVTSINCFVISYFALCFFIYLQYIEDIVDLRGLFVNQKASIITYEIVQQS